MCLSLLVFHLRQCVGKKKSFSFTLHQLQYIMFWAPVFIIGAYSFRVTGEPDATLKCKFVNYLEGKLECTGTCACTKVCASKSYVLIRGRGCVFNICVSLAACFFFFLKGILCIEATFKETYCRTLYQFHHLGSY